MALPPHIPLAIRIMPLLVACANEKRRTNIDELSAFVGGETRLFSRSLGWIRDNICTVHKIPPITVLVENKGSDTKSNSFDPGKWADLKGPAYEAYKQEKLAEVYAYPRWDAVLKALQEMFAVEEPFRVTIPSDRG